MGIGNKKLVVKNLSFYEINFLAINILLLFICDYVFMIIV
jgi:hypothetical protein